MKHTSTVSADAQKLISLILDNTRGDEQEETAAALVELSDIFLNIGGTVVVWALQRNGIIKPEQVKLIEQMVLDMLDEGEQGMSSMGGTGGLVH